tara:strand:- start:10865 stop:11077 length:213 start_codon:yes stop_codon:yes gene_type:complete
MDEDRKKFVARLSIAMIHKEVTRKEMAEGTGISIGVLNQIFQGAPVSNKRMNILRKFTGFSETEFIQLKL